MKIGSTGSRDRLILRASRRGGFYLSVRVFGKRIGFAFGGNFIRSAWVS